MYETLSPRMQQVIQRSERIAREFEQDYVGTEHLLLAILLEDDGKAAALLKARGVNETRAREVIARLMKQKMEDSWVTGRLPGSPHYRNTITAAIEQARQCESKQVETEHLLLALLHEKGSVAYVTLHELGVTAGDIQAALNAGN